MKKKVLLGIFLALVSIGILTSCGTEKEKEKVACKLKLIRKAPDEKTAR